MFVAPPAPDEPTPSGRLPSATAALLGLVVIVGFGAWFYGFGVLFEPIRDSTGWSDATLSTTYGLSLLGAGVLATAVGRLLHRHGPRPVYGVGAAATLIAYLVLAEVATPSAFVVTGIVVGSLTGALGYYAAVHTVIAQLVPADQRAREITVNTLWGAFSSPLALPLLAWVVLAVDWRATVRLSGIVVAVVFLATAVAIPDGRGADEDHLPLRAAIAEVSRDPVVLALLATTFAGGVATSLIILYQVPVMVAAGLGLSLASGLAGARGFLQLAGRLPMPWLIRRVGSRRTLRLSHAVCGVSCLLLLGAGSVPVAVLFAAVAGFGIGALVPVESIFSADAVRRSAIGMVLGVSSLTRGIGAAVGPVAAGALTGATGSRTAALIMAAAFAILAAALVPRIRPTAETDAAAA